MGAPTGPVPPHPLASNLSQVEPADRPTPTRAPTDGTAEVREESAGSSSKS